MGSAEGQGKGSIGAFMGLITQNYEWVAKRVWVKVACAGGGGCYIKL
jgi:hypothetical protein